MLSEKRERFKRISNWTGNVFSKLGLSPNQYTLISLIFASVAFYFLIKGRLICALIFFLLAALLDFIDGAIARFLQKETKKGAYLDTICDRYVEGIILLGFLFLPLPNLFLPARIWIFLAFFGSLMTTYAKAAAKEKGATDQEFKKGLLGRPERIILISSVLLLGALNLSWAIYPIVILAILANFTALQRIFSCLRPS